MSNINPTKSQVLSVVTTRLAPFYTKHVHRYACGRFIKLYERKPTLEDALELVNIFDNEWGLYYDVKELQDKNIKNSKKFYEYCVPLQIDVNKAIFGFTSSEGENEIGTEEKYPFTAIIEGNKFDNFVEYVKAHNLELRHVPAKLLKRKTERRKAERFEIKSAPLYKAELW